MTNQNRLSEIVIKEKKSEIIPFFKSLTTESKKGLIPHVKALSKEYLEYREVEKNGSTTITQKATTIQREILGLASFMCLSLKDFERGYYGIFGRKELNLVLEWYCPSWFNDYINKFANAEYIPFDINYDWTIELSEKGYIQPAKDFIAKLIPQMIYESKENKWTHVPENVYKRDITLKEHIWYIFEYETAINWSDRYLNFQDQSKSIERGWTQTLKKISDEGKIERSRLLKESLLATSQNFNKTLSGWFADLFSYLDPSNDELLRLQNELFTTLDSVNSKPINTSLKFIRKIAQEKAFLTDRFLEKVSLLLTSDTKSVVTSTMVLLETIAKNNKGKQTVVCEMACQAFIHHDEEIQSKAAKLIGKYGIKGSKAIQNALLPYHDSLFSQAKDLLQEFSVKNTKKDSEVEQVIETYVPKPKIHEENKIEPIENFDEFLFLASQAFDGNEPYHFDLLPAAIIRLQDEIKGDNIAKLEPAFQRAYKLVMNEWHSTVGFLDHLLATFFIDYARMLISKYPKDSISIKKIHDSYVIKDVENKKQWSHYSLRIVTTDEWVANNLIYGPFKHLLRVALHKIKNQSALPLLSTPTHAPGWVSPGILIERLSQYQAAKTKPDDFDFQIALSRCALENGGTEVEFIDKKLTGEYAALMQYLLKKDGKPPTNLTQPSLWTIACLTKRKIGDFENFAKFPCQINPGYLTGQFKWETKSETRLIDRYDYAKRTNIKEPYTTKSLRILFEDKTGINSVFAKFKSALKIELPIIYELLTIKEKYFSSEHNDIRRLLFLIPNNPEPILAQVTSRCLTYSHFWEEGHKKIVAKTIGTLLEIWDDFGEMAHLFVATCLISSDKTIRDFASEVWIHGVRQQSINSTLIGEIIGIQERIEFAPIKRLTDLVLSNMFQLSDQHNSELEKMLTGCIVNLPKEPISNLKKLLEIYAEITTINGTKNISEKIIRQVELWESSESLKKVIKIIKNKNQ